MISAMLHRRYVLPAQTCGGCYVPVTECALTLASVRYQAVRITDIMKMAEQAKLKVSFELPL